MKLFKARLVTTLVLALSATWLPAASAEVDPFPNLASGAEIPGTRIWGQPGASQSTYEASSEYLAWVATGCPAGAGTGVGVDMNFTETHADDRYFNYCIKTWRPAVIESTTVISTPIVAPESSTSVVETVTLVTSQATTPAPVNTSGFGGYAVVHPDGHVCGVVVSASNDPFNNGGFMPQEYMGCPAGSRFVFQSAPSADGNVAGWHGQDVVLKDNTYTLPGGSTLTGGIVTDPNGRTWNSGTGVVLSPGTVDTRTVASDTRTAGFDTSTVLAGDSRTVVIAPLSALPTLTGADSATSLGDLDALPEIAAEEEISNSIEAVVIGNKTRIAIASQWADTRLTVVATKKGSKKKYTYRVTTDANGDYTFKSSVNLKGFTIILLKGSDELDRDIA